MADESTDLCPVCGLSFPSQTSLQDHMQAHNESVLCPQCGKSFPHRRALTEHLRLHREGPFTCTVCNKQFKYPSGLSRHRELHRREKRFVCNVCDKVFACRTTLRNHLRTHSDIRPFVCNVCGKSYRSSHSLQIHKELHLGDNSLQCKICSLPFKSKSSLETHQNSHGDLDCNICENVRGLSLEALNKHLRIVHKVGSQTEKKRQPAPKKEQVNIQCSFCNKWFSSSGALQLHMKVHINTTVCVRCHRSFSRMADLRRHVRTHDGEVPWLCACCGASMPDENQLNMHLATIHGVREIYKCQYCALKFFTRMSYNFHLSKHMDRPMKYACSVCNRQFVHRSYAVRHLKVHSNEKPFHCNICSKSFAWKLSLTVHMRIHSNDRRFKCHICDKKFLLEMQLKYHMNKHDVQRNFMCKICGRSFNYPSTLASHMRCHTKHKPYQCQICRMRFINYSAIGYHIRKKHNQSISKRLYTLLQDKNWPQDDAYPIQIQSELSIAGEVQDDTSGVESRPVQLPSGDTVLLPNILTESTIDKGSSIIESIQEEESTDYTDKDHWNLITDETGQSSDHQQNILPINPESSNVIIEEEMVAEVEEANNSCKLILELLPSEQDLDGPSDEIQQTLSNGDYQVIAKEEDQQVQDSTSDLQASIVEESTEGNNLYFTENGEHYQVIIADDQQTEQDKLYYEPVQETQDKEQVASENNQVFTDTAGNELLVQLENGDYLKATDPQQNMGEVNQGEFQLVYTVPENSEITQQVPEATTKQVIEIISGNDTENKDLIGESYAQLSDGTYAVIVNEPDGQQEQYALGANVDQSSQLGFIDNSVNSEQQNSEIIELSDQVIQNNENLIQVLTEQGSVINIDKETANIEGIVTLPDGSSVQLFEANSAEFEALENISQKVNESDSNYHKIKLEPEVYSDKKQTIIAHPSDVPKTGYSALECKQCGNVYKNKSTLTRHIRTIHDNIQKSSCDWCQREFKWKSALDLHRKRHSKQKEYACRLCSEIFGYQCQLYDHIEQVHKISKWPQRTMATGRTKNSAKEKNSRETGLVIGGNEDGSHLENSKNVDNLELKNEDVSLKIKKENNTNDPPNWDTSLEDEGVIKCDWCNRVFNCMTALAKHKKNSTSQTGFSCEYCNQMFEHRCVMFLHMEDQHDRIMFDKARRYRGIEPKNEGSKVDCSLCKKQFKHQMSLVTHERRNQPLQAFECGECREWFTGTCVLAKHVSEAHNMRMADYKRIMNARKSGVKKYYVPKKERDKSGDTQKNIIVIRKHNSVDDITVDDLDSLFDTAQKENRLKAHNVVVIKKDKEETINEKEVVLSKLNTSNDELNMESPNPIKLKSSKQIIENKDENQRVTNLEQSVLGESQEVTDKVTVYKGQKVMDEGQEVTNEDEGVIGEDQQMAETSEDENLEDYEEIYDSDLRNENKNASNRKKLQKESRLLHIKEEQIEEGEIPYKPTVETLDEDDVMEDNVNSAIDINDDEEDQLQCSKCKEYFLTLPELHDHVVSCLDEPLECEFCPSVFLLKSDLLKHRCDIGTNPVSCSDCYLSFFSSYHLYKHMEKRHNNQKENCAVCCAGFRFMQEFLLHLDEHHTDIEIHCKMCSQKFKTNSELNHHIKIDHSGEAALKCPTCSQVFTNSSKLRRHRKICSEAVSSSESRTVQCIECRKHVPMVYYPQHLAKHNIAGSTEDELGIKEGNRLVECRICGRQVQRHYLPHHMKRHASKQDDAAFKLFKGKEVGKLVECETCGASVTEEYLKKHLEKYCKGVRKTNIKAMAGKAKCEDCGQFVTKRYLAKHQEKYCKKIYVHEKLKDKESGSDNDYDGAISNDEDEDAMSNEESNGEENRDELLKDDNNREENRNKQIEIDHSNSEESKSNEITEEENQDSVENKLIKKYKEQYERDCKNKRKQLSNNDESNTKDNLNTDKSKTNVDKDNSGIDIASLTDDADQMFVEVSFLELESAINADGELLEKNIEEIQNISIGKEQFIEMKLENGSIVRAQMIEEDSDQKKSKVEQVKCEKCQQWFSKYYIQKHVQTHVFKDKMEKLRESNRYPCPHCNLRMKNKRDLEQHIKRHKGKVSRNFVCEVCNKKFEKPSALKAHMYVHSKDKPHSCHLCDLKFSLMSNKNRHIRTMHKNEIENV